jgi:hypothetical protein
VNMWYDIECEFMVCVGHVIVIEMVNRWEDQEPFVFYIYIYYLNAYQIHQVWSYILCHHPFYAILV